MSTEKITEEITGRLRAAGCVFAEDEAALLQDAAGDDSELERLVAERVAGTPLEQVVGWAEFDGLRVYVEPGVFVPRRRSALLVRLAGEAIRPGSVVVDLCCGTGALAAALLRHEPRIEVHAADLDPVAVRAARRNLPPERVHAGDLYDALPGRLRGRVDVLVVNAPYVPTAAIATMPPEARDHEHLIALDGGPDGLDVQRRVAAGVREWLAPEGLVVVETGRDQALTTAALLAAVGLTTQMHLDEDSAGCAVGGRPGRAAGSGSLG